MICKKQKHCLLFYFLFSGILLFTTSATVFGQGGECSQATFLPDVTNYCSGIAEFTNAGATASGFGPAGCFSNNSNDVWFSFTAVATDVVVTANGASGQGAGGSLNGPEVALYVGDCDGTITNIQCETDDFGTNIVELTRGSLVIGETYFIRIDGNLSNTGSFQLCVNNYFPPVLPGSDCIDATILCDKSSFSIQQIIGAGNDNDEAAGTCLSGLGPSESSSTWYTWTAATNGTLEFTLNPNNPSDDLDFVVFELPSGVQNCGDKIPLLCMASGSFDFPSPCMGPTGLRAGSGDSVEEIGCQPGDDNFLDPLNMSAGTSYALLVNNFTNTGSGFSISFGGTGEFVGPTADFNTSASTICAGESITITDNSSFGLGNITGWNWTFGVGSTPQTANTQGPHTVTYNEPGTITIVLTIETSLGCVLTETSTLLVEPCCNSLNPLVTSFTQTNLACAEDMDGTIDVEASSNYPPISFEWSDGSSDEDRTGLSPGGYIVTIIDDIGCEEVITVDITGPPAYEFASSITMPTCDGGSDGAVLLTVSGATPPFTFQWTDTNTGALIATTEDLNNIPIGDYTLTITDANGCSITEDYEVRELELLLDPAAEVVVEPLCNGDSNGSLTVNIANGLAPYQFDFNDGNGPQPSNTLPNITAGTYTVVAFDANNCMGTFTFDVGEPDSLLLDLTPTAVSCFGSTDGILTSLASGGTLPYTYNWSIAGAPDEPEITDIAPGFYSLTIVDNNGCIAIDTATVLEPDIFIVDQIDVVDNLCAGGEAGSLIVIGLGGVPPYTYSVDGVNFQASNELSGLEAGTYTVTIRDANNCEATGEAAIIEPLPIEVQAFSDQTIDLGFTAELQAVNNSPDPFTYSWSPSESLSCDDCALPTAMPVNTTTYVVTLTTSNGCTVSDSVTIRVNKVRPVYIPNAFTPNGDGINDLFLIFGGPAVAQVRRLSIFDRWGELVYDAENIPTDAPALGWDGTFNGKRLNPGVLVYYAEVDFIDGFTEAYKGDVTLIR